MSFYYFGSTIRHGCLRICAELFSKKVFRNLYNLWPFFVNINFRKCKRVFLYAAKDLSHLTCTIFNIHQGSFLLRSGINLFQESQKSLRGANSLFQESEKSLRGANNLFQESRKSLRGAINLFQESQKSLRGVNLFQKSQKFVRDANLKFCRESFKNNNSGSKNSGIREIKACTNTFLTAVPDHVSDCKTCLGPVDSRQSNLPQCFQNHRHSRLCYKVITRRRRIRNREPSRIPLKMVIQALKRRKSKQKCKKMLSKAVPVSSIIHSIATNYKYWKTRCILREDSFYSYYFKRTRKSTVSFHSSERIILLSGDVELNPGPVNVGDMSAIKEITSSEPNDCVLKYRMLRYRLRPLDVGGGGDCFFKSACCTSI